MNLAPESGGAEGRQASRPVGLGTSTNEAPDFPLSDGDYCRLLKKYGFVWRVRRQEDGIYAIKGRLGDVQPWSLTDAKTLCGVADFPSIRRKTAALRKLDASGVPFKITQEGDADFCFTFSDEPGALERVKPILGLYRSRKTPPKQATEPSSTSISSQTLGDRSPL